MLQDCSQPPSSETVACVLAEHYEILEETEKWINDTRSLAVAYVDSAVGDRELLDHFVTVDEIIRNKKAILHYITQIFIRYKSGRYSRDHFNKIYRERLPYLSLDDLHAAGRKLLEKLRMLPMQACYA